MERAQHQQRDARARRHLRPLAGIAADDVAGWDVGGRLLLHRPHREAGALQGVARVGLGLAGVFVWNGTLQSSAIVEAQNACRQVGDSAYEFLMEKLSGQP